MTLDEHNAQTARTMFKEKWPGTYIRVRVQQLVILSGSIQVSLSRRRYIGQVLLNGKNVTAPGKQQCADIVSETVSKLKQTS